MGPILMALAAGAGWLFWQKKHNSANSPAKLAIDLAKPVAARPHVDTTLPKPKLKSVAKAGSPHAIPSSPTVVNVVKVINPTLSLPDQATAKAMTAKQVVLKRGDTGPSVVRLQTNMGEPTTAIFDDRLEGLVKQLQKAHGLKADGIVGPKTWAIFA